MASSRVGFINHSGSPDERHLHSWLKKKKFTQLRTFDQTHIALSSGQFWQRIGYASVLNWWEGILKITVSKQGENLYKESIFL